MKVSNAPEVVLGLVFSLLPLQATAIPAQPATFPPLLDATLDELRHGLDSGHFTSVDLTKAYIARIKEVANDLRPVNEINPDALVIAAEMDMARQDEATNRGPLHGIPILIKDNIATSDKMNNTAGSFALLGAEPKEDSTVAAKLRKAGVIILGKANLSQWANFRSVNTSNGWSSYGGQTKGAYFRDQDPKGSSSGSGVSSSIGLAWATLGTETSGSIVSPANVNNLVGFKPTVGLTSRYLVVPISEHQDTVGPLARTVKDAAYLLTAIGGADNHDNYTSAIPFKGRLPDYVAACRKDGLKGKRLGVPRDWLPPQNNTSPVMKAFEETLNLLRSEGATIIDNIRMPGLAKIGPAVSLVLGADMLTDVATSYLSRLKTNPHNITTLEKLQAFTQEFSMEEFPKRDTQLWQNSIERGFDNTSPEFWGNYTEQLYFAGPLGILGALKNNSLDAIVFPTDFMTTMPGIVGSPVITVPLGKQPADAPIVKSTFGNLNDDAPNRPFGLAFAGPRFSEETLIEIAYTFEQKTNVRGTVQPLVKPKTELRHVTGSGGNATSGRGGSGIVISSSSISSIAWGVLVLCCAIVLGF